MEALGLGVRTPGFWSPFSPWLAQTPWASAFPSLALCSLIWRMRMGPVGFKVLSGLAAPDRGFSDWGLEMCSWGCLHPVEKNFKCLHAFILIIKNLRNEFIYIKYKKLCLACSKPSLHVRYFYLETNALAIYQGNASLLQWEFTVERHLPWVRFWFLGQYWACEPQRSPRQVFSSKGYTPVKSE